MLRLKLKYVLANKQARLILLLTLVVSCSIAIFGLVSYNQYREVLDTELNVPNVELLQINLDVTNRAFRESDGKAVEASFHEETQGYIRSEPGDSARMADELQSYLKALSTEPDIHSIMVIRLDDRSLVSSIHGFQQNWSAAPDAFWSSWIDDIRTKPLLVKRRTLQAGAGRDAEQTELLSLVRPVTVDGQIKGAVMVNLSYDRLFSKMYTHLTSYQYVYNLDGELIYPKLNLPVPPEEMEKVIEAINVRPFDYVEVNGQDFMANQTFSDVTGWRLVSLVPMDQLLKNVKMVRNAMLVLSLISILVGCSAMLYYNYAAFKPLKRINRLLSQGERPVSQGDLYDLEQVLGKLVGDFRSKTLAAERSLPELRSKFIGDVLNGSIGSREIRTKWEQHFQEWEEGPLAMMIVSVDRYGRWMAELQDEDRMLLRYALNNIVLELLESSWRAVSTTVRQEGLAIMLQPKSAGAGNWMEELKQEAYRLIQAAEQYLSMSISIGIGSAVPGVLQLGLSSAEAGEVLSYRLYEGYGQVHCYAGNETMLKAGTQPVDAAWKHEVVSSLLAADSGLCREWIRKMADEARSRRAEPHAVYREADGLLSEVQRIVEQQGLSTPGELADYTWLQLATMDLHDVTDLLTRVTDQLCSQLEQHRHSKEYHLVQAMIHYMEDNLHLNIGLQDVADHVHLGISSVSAMFKEETGSTVYDYLTALRIEKACGLLRETQLKVSEISQLVGYHNENSFIRTFRKNKSITPGKFRESFKSSNGYADPPKPRDSGISAD
ncbi:AraC family transcriptional regulator [Paenibacillus sambharensis]|uniref:AraC family transcriptional regulator n=1 Tax=Paenibacillus sambharensis TaxID=1803190 RepID=A0A2W1M0R3_9BACL|nr:helix-turn-helix domain-containing protein [Paenibacillus sambharensis]PZD97521.1 AraC family transcriptional regulator [Paenibacillus sambharensis]